MSACGPRRRSVSGRPKPTSSRRTMRMFGASGGRWFGSARRTCFDSCNVGPATLAVGIGGNGETEPSVGGVASAARAWVTPMIRISHSTIAQALSQARSSTRARRVRDHQFICYCPWLTSVMRLDLLQLRLHRLEGLTDAGAEADLADRNSWKEARCCWTAGSTLARFGH